MAFASSSSSARARSMLGCARDTTDCPTFLITAQKPGRAEMASSSDRELRQRLIPQSEEAESRPLSMAELPYSGKVYMARKKKPDPLYVRVLEVCVSGRRCSEQ